MAVRRRSSSPWHGPRSPGWASRRTGSWAGVHTSARVSPPQGAEGGLESSPRSRSPGCSPRLWRDQGSRREPQPICSFPFRLSSAAKNVFLRRRQRPAQPHGHLCQNTSSPHHHTSQFAKPLASNLSCGPQNFPWGDRVDYFHFHFLLAGDGSQGRSYGSHFIDVETEVQRIQNSLFKITQEGRDTAET
jgi:hypothetical protein